MNEGDCPHCGRTHPAGARFCPGTGKSLPEPQACPSCGEMVLPNWNVCPRCGIPLGIGPPPPELLPTPRRSRIWSIVVISALVLIIAGGILIFRNQVTIFPKEQEVEIPSTGVVTAVSKLLLDSQESTKTISASLTPNPFTSPTLIPTLDTKIESTQAAQTTEARFTETSLKTPTITINTTAAQITSPILTGDALSTPTPLPINSSPGGKIVFTCQIYQDANRNQICLSKADGTGWTRLSSDDHADHTYPSFSPDGESIVFSLTKGGDRQIFEMDLYGRQRQLTYLPLKAYAPAISPDNRRIVFTGNDGEQQLLWVMDRDGSNPICLTPTISGEAFDPAWSPDGRQILFAATVAGDTQLYVINGDGSGPRQITQLSQLRGRSDWSPDGETIATYRGLSWQREVILLARDGEFLAQITDGGNNLAPNFSPDGQWVAFTSYRDYYRNDNGCEIYIMRLDGSQIERVTENNYCDWQPNWGP